MLNRNRLKRVLANMEKAGLEQILVSSTESIYYLTGIWVVPFERMYALYLRTDGTVKLFGNELFCLEPEDGMELIIHSDGRDPVPALAAALRPGRLGVDKNWPAHFLICLLELRRDITPVDGSAPVDAARLQKDADEIAAMRHASQINDAVMELAVGMLHDGVKESELTDAIEKLYRERGGERSPEGLIASFGPNGANPHHGPDDTVIRPGDSVVFDLYTPIRRYWCDMTRTVFFRSATPEQRAVYEAVRQANLAAERVIRPGVPMKEFDLTARKVLEDAGYGRFFTHRLGHGCGLECHEMPENSRTNETIALPGMVFSVEPGAYLPGNFGVRIEDLVLVTETGCEPLNHVSKEMRIV